MKHRRFLAALTALTLGLSLSVPALAAEAAPTPTPEETAQLGKTYGLETPEATNGHISFDLGWTPTAPANVDDGALDYSAFEAQFIAEYKAAHPEEYAAFDPYAWFGVAEGDDYLAYFKEAYGLTDETAFKDYMWAEYLGDKTSAAYDAQQVEAYRAAHPGELEALDVNELLARQGYLDPMEEYMENHGLDTEEAAKTSLLADYVHSRQWAADTRAQAEAYRAADPESWADFDADAYYDAEYGYYGYSKEDYMFNNYLLTEEEFIDDMYVEYMEWHAYDMPSWPNERPLTLVSNGEQIDAELTAADGVTYVSAETANTLFGAHFTEESVPLRAAAEANGWDVVWNANQNQVVLLNRETMMSGTDFSSFDKLMNRLMKAQVGEAGQSYRTTGTSDISFTAFNSIDGDKTYHATVKSEALFRDNVYDVTVTVSVADLLGLLSQQTLDKLAADMPKFTLKDLKTLLTGVKVELIMNLDTGMVYWNAPILASFDDSVSADTWYALDLGLTADSLQKMMAGEWNTADILYDELVAQSESSWSPTYSYYSFTSSLDTLALLFGADRFTESGGTLTWKIDAKTVNGLMSELAGQDVSLFKEYDMAISVSENGKFSAKAALRMDMDAMAAMIADSSWYATGAAETAAITWAMNLFDFRMASSSSGTADQASGTAEFHWKNQFSLKMDTQSSRKKTSDVPAAAPPEGAELVELGSF